MRAFRVAYVGHGYHGFQRQPDVETVEGTLLAALTDLGVIEASGTIPPGYAAAGRTDAGVSALAQTVAFEAPAWLSPPVLSNALPDDIGVWAHAEVPDDFHARHHAVARTYEYHLVPELDLTAAAAALERLSGEHDFHNLTPDDHGTVRSIQTALESAPTGSIVRITADGFPRQLVRRIVSLVTSVASGAVTLDRIDRLLEGPPVDGPLGVEPAPPEALLLTDVTYPAVTFEADETARASVADAFATRCDTLEARRRVAERIRAGVTSSR